MHARKKAILDPFPTDPFIFAVEPGKANYSDDRILRLKEYADTQALDCYYGYPILLYKGEDGRSKLAPLLVQKVGFGVNQGTNFCQPEEVLPTLGLKACEQLGLRSEEISLLGEALNGLLAERQTSKNIQEAVLSLLRNESTITLPAALDPTNVGSPKLSDSTTPGIHNHSVLFVGENTAFNAYMLEDLGELLSRKDLEATALRFLIGKSITSGTTGTAPVLPFHCNEYQVAAIEQAQSNDLTVVTGPPGTGKSQFIANLAVNLFLQGKKTLFVSHTNEAVDVVNRNLTDHFPNLMLRTGNKDQRQQLNGHVNALFQDVQPGRTLSISRNTLEADWSALLQKRTQLLEMASLELEYERTAQSLADDAALWGFGTDAAQLLRALGARIQPLTALLNRIESLDTKCKTQSFGWWERFLLIFQPRRFEGQLRGLVDDISTLLGAPALNVLRRRESALPLSGVDDPHWSRIRPLLALSSRQLECDRKLQRLECFPSRLDLEGSISRGEDRYFESCRQFLRETYLHAIVKTPRDIGKIKSFINEVSRTFGSDERTLGRDFRTALESLRLWSCTLKSLRRSFPLEAGVFDYVIFDEASQIDLPSAAPALYRAKRAIVVGDPMQLPHISTLSPDIERAAASRAGLDAYPDFYPSRVGYRTTSLFKAAEAALSSPPAYLTNHYRSEDEIIGLCNEVFYGKRLKIFTRLDHVRYPPELPRGLHWVDCKGTAIRPSSGSRINSEEATQVVTTLVETLQKAAGSPLTIGVVTPYSAQRERISQELLRRTTEDQRQSHDIKVLTAHKFQGSERDIMIFSPVLAGHGDGNDDKWFNAYPQILNVALSRARHLLWIVGDQAYCRSRPGVLGRISKAYDEIKRSAQVEELCLGERFDTPTERLLFTLLQRADLERKGYRLVPKYVDRRYTLDIALLGPTRIDLECDGEQHELLDGVPIIEDVERDRYLSARGWKVIRIPNRRLLHDPNQVVADVMAAMEPA